MSAHKFLNVVACDDVRDEVGNKKSLMGAFAGDLLVQTFPAQVQIAVYIQFQPDASRTANVLKIRLYVEDEQLIEGTMTVTPTDRPAAVVLPKGVVTFDKPSTFRVTASVDDGEFEELLSFRTLPLPSISPTASAQPVLQSPTGAPST